MLKLFRCRLSLWYFNTKEEWLSLRVTRWGRERARFIPVTGEWFIRDKNGSIIKRGVTTSIQEIIFVRLLALELE